MQNVLYPAVKDISVCQKVLHGGVVFVYDSSGIVLNPGTFLAADIRLSPTFNE